MITKVIVMTLGLDSALKVLIESILAQEVDAKVFLIIGIVIILEAALEIEIGMFPEIDTKTILVVDIEVTLGIDTEILIKTDTEMTLEIVQQALSGISSPTIGRTMDVREIVTRIGVMFVIGLDI